MQAEADESTMRLAGQGMTELTRFTWRGDRWIPMCARCPRCGTTFFPARVLCPEDLLPCQPEPLPQGGRLFASTRIELPPAGFQVPLFVGYVDYPDLGIRVFAQLDEDCAAADVRGCVVYWRMAKVRDNPATMGMIFSRRSQQAGTDPADGESGAV
jgi:uncharacterized OB-fold protein